MLDTRFGLMIQLKCRVYSCRDARGGQRLSPVNSGGIGVSMKGLRARLLGELVPSRLSEADPAVARDYYQSVIDSVASVICTVDRELHVTGVNRRWDEFALANWGQEFTSDRVLGVFLLDLMGDVLLKRWETVCQQILDGELPLYLDEVVREGQATWQNYTLAASPLKSSQGEILGITLVATNITQLKKAEAEMLKRLVEIRGFHQVAHTAGASFNRRAFHKQVTADLAHLFGAEKCVIFRWGESSGHLEAQFPAFGVTGPELAELSLDIGDPDDPSSLWQDLEERDYILLNEGDTAPGNMIEASARVDRLAAMMAVLRVSGRVHGTILIAGRDRPFTEQDGQLAATFAVPIVLAIEDAELHQRLLDRVRQLEALREELDRITKVAESVRMPLTVIHGYVELLLDGTLGAVSEGHVSVLGTLLEKTREISGAVNQLLPSRFVPDATRYESIDLAKLLRKAYDKWVPSARLAGVNLDAASLSVEGEQYTTAGDPALLLDVFDAVLDNAIKFTPAGGTVRISLHGSTEIVYAQIQDSGVGIPVHRLPQIWQPKEAEAPSYPIGLAEVKQIVEHHGGQVWVESQPGTGSIFYVVLPRIAGNWK
jgi:PAS domain S-box-containing protein